MAAGRNRHRLRLLRESRPSRNSFTNQVKTIFKIRALVGSLLLAALFSTQALALEAHEWNERGIKASEQEKREEAIYFFERARAAGDSNDTIRRNLVTAHLNLAKHLSTIGLHRKALSRIDAAEKAAGSADRATIASTKATILNNHGTYLAEKKKWSEAIGQLEEALKISGDQERIAKNLAVIYHNYAASLAGPKRLAVLKKSLSHDPHSVEIIRETAEEYYDLNEFDEAISLMARALAIRPSDGAIASRLMEFRADSAAQANYRTTKRSRFTIVFEGREREELASRTIDILDGAFYTLKNRIGFFPKRRVTVIIYTGDEYKRVTGAPDWSAGRYDGKIRIPEGSLLISDLLAKDILYHEYVHALVHERCGNAIPAWWNEGLADMTEPSNKWNDARRRRVGAKLGTELWVPLDELRHYFSRITDPKRVVQAYAESESLMQYLEARSGRFSFVQLMNLVSDGEPFDDAFYKIYRMDMQALEKNWIAYLKN